MTHLEQRPGRPLISANAERHPELWTESSIEVHAFHCHSLGAVRQHAARRLAGKLVVISDDGHRETGSYGTSPATVEAFLGVCREHGVPYEHLSIPLSTKGESGALIAGRDTFPPQARAALGKLSGAGDALSAGGVLGVLDGRATWDGRPVQLVGASWYGALVAARTDLEAYLDTLHGYGLNFTRVWLVEQWTTLGAFGPNPGETVGRTPFTGEFEDRYDLRRLDDAYFEHLDRFLRLAGERGLVVQLSLFDRAGLHHQGRPTRRNPERWGHAWGSPYRRRNNHQALFEIDYGGYPDRFVETTGPVASLHGLLIDRVAKVARDHRNVIVEIMNEPLDVWGERTVAWHRWVAERLRGAWD